MTVMKLILFALVAANLRLPKKHTHAHEAAKAHGLTVKAGEQEMTMDEAMSKFGSKLPAQVLEEIQKGQQKNAGAVVLHSDESMEKEEPLSGLQKAINKLNEMMEGAESDRDTSFIQCTENIGDMSNQLAINAALRSQLSGDMAISMGDKATAKEDGTKCALEMESTKASIADLRLVCEKSMAGLQEQVDLLQSDLEVGKMILNMTQCDDPAGDAAAFMQCGSSNGKLSYEFGHEKAKQLQGQIKTATGQVAMQRAAKLALGRSLGEHAYVSKSRRARKTKTSHKVKMLAKSEYTLFNNRRMSIEALAMKWKETPANRTAGPSAEALADLDRISAELASAGPPDFGASTGKCTVAGSPMCMKLRDALTQMVAEVAYGLFLAEEAFTAEQRRCEDEDQKFNKHLYTWSEGLQSAQTKFMYSTALNNEQTQTLTEKVDEANSVGQHLLEYQAECEKTIREANELICGVKVIRLELDKMSDVKVGPIQDCILTDWEDGACSAECGGGERDSTRSVTIPAAGGAECGALTKKESCNMMPCPIDCVVNAFSEFGACSSACGGGTMKKGRQIGTDAEWGGAACPALDETAECNVASCTLPCELGDWSDWSSCDKMCDGGEMVRNRGVVREKGPEGYCPGETLEECDPADEIGCRIEAAVCNVEKCPPALSCSTELDLIILVDSSGSLGDEGWEKTKGFTKDLIQQLEMASVKTGLIRYSAAADVISELTHDKDALLAAATEMSFIQESTQTALALETAETEFNKGARPEAASAILLITDGNANSMPNAIAAAKKARETAKLIVVPIGSAVNMEVIDMMVNYEETGDATFPIEDFDALNSMVTGLIATMCDSVECSEDLVDERGMGYRGCQTQTRGGWTCQTWAHQYPSSHYYSFTNFPEAGLGVPFESEHNFCRNPDGDSTIWCVVQEYTTNSAAPWWEYCDTLEFSEPFY